jgi:hypothetical protein
VLFAFGLKVVSRAEKIRTVGDDEWTLNYFILTSGNPALKRLCHLGREGRVHRKEVGHRDEERL